MAITYTARFVRGGKQLIIDGSDYNLGQDFTLPATVASPVIAGGNGSNSSVGGKLIDTQYTDGTFTFTIQVRGTTDSEITRLARRLSQFLQDGPETIFLKFSPNTLPIPLIGQFGAELTIEFVHLTVGPVPDYLISNLRTRTANIQITAEVKPFLSGTETLAARAKGGVWMETLGSPSGESLGLRVAPPTTNLVPNPVFSHAIWDNGWINPDNLVISQHKGPDFVFPGAVCSAQIFARGDTLNYYLRLLTLAGAGSYSLSAIIARQDGQAITDTSLVQIVWGSPVTTSYEDLGNGWYRIYADGLNSADGSPSYCGIKVNTNTALYLMAFQVEKKAAHTPVCFGDMLGCAWTGLAHDSTSTRTAGVFANVMDASRLHMDNGSIALVWKPDFDQVSGGTRTLFEASTGGFRAYYNADTNVISFTDGTNSATASSQTMTGGVPMLLVFTWQANEALHIYKNGATQIGVSGAMTPPVLPAYLYTGNDYNGVNQAGGIFQLFEVYDHRLTTTEIGSLYAAVQPLMADKRKIDEIPYIWSIDGDSVVDFYRDATHSNVAIISGVGGDVPAKTIYHLTPSTAGISITLGACANPWYVAPPFVDVGAIPWDGALGAVHEDDPVPEGGGPNIPPMPDPPITTGRDYYVSVNGGSDTNSGTSITSPWKTLYYASSHISISGITGGVTVWVRGGVYYEDTSWAVHGTAANPIVLRPYPGETVWIDGENYTNPTKGSGNFLLTIWANYMTVQGLNFRYSGEAGISLRGQYSVARDCYLHHIWGGAICLSGNNELVEYCTVEYASLMEEHLQAADWGSGITCGRYPDYGTIRYNVVHDVWGEGISCFESSHCVLKGNIVYNCMAIMYCSDSAYSLFEQNLSYATPGNEIQTYLHAAGHAQTNLLVGDELGWPQPLSGTGVRENSRNNTFRNNLFLGASRCMAIGPEGLENSYWENNTCVNAALDANILFYSGSATGQGYFRNNLIIQDGALPIASWEGLSAGPTPVFAHNLWSKTPPSTVLGADHSYVNANTGMLRTGQVAPGVLTGEYFKISATSPCVGAGTAVAEVTDDYYGMARSAGTPDIGAYEYTTQSGGGGGGSGTMVGAVENYAVTNGGIQFPSPQNVLAMKGELIPGWIGKPAWIFASIADGAWSAGLEAAVAVTVQGLSGGYDYQTLPSDAYLRQFYLGPVQISEIGQYSFIPKTEYLFAGRLRRAAGYSTNYSTYLDFYGVMPDKVATIRIWNAETDSVILDGNSAFGYRGLAVNEICQVRGDTIDIRPDQCNIVTIMLGEHGSLSNISATVTVTRLLVTPRWRFL